MNLFKKNRNRTEEIILGENLLLKDDNLNKFEKVTITNKRLIVETEKSKRTIPIIEISDITWDCDNKENIIEIRFTNKTVRDKHSIAIRYIPDNRDIKITTSNREYAKELYNAVCSAITG